MVAVWLRRLKRGKKTRLSAAKPRYAALLRSQLSPAGGQGHSQFYQLDFYVTTQPSLILSWAPRKNRSPIVSPSPLLHLPGEAPGGNGQNPHSIGKHDGQMPPHSAAVQRGAAGFHSMIEGQGTGDAAKGIAQQ